MIIRESDLQLQCGRAAESDRNFVVSTEPVPLTPATQELRSVVRVRAEWTALTLSAFP